MIPNVFVSSTIADLQYLRDGLREAIEEICYHPVMSEHGEVGYLNPMTAAESCYSSVSECQMAVLIIGTRYGSVGTDGLSITNREFLAAKKAELPILTFVQPKVLSYKDVFDAEPGATLWDTFAAMDNPRKTFQFLDDIKTTEAYNAIIPFVSVGDAKRLLKFQLAHFVGQRLSAADRISGAQLKDLLAEIKTLRNQFVHQAPDAAAQSKETKRYLTTTRFLLNESAAEYRDFVEKLFGDIDAAIAALPNFPDVSGVLSAAEFKYEIVELAVLRSHLQLQSPSREFAGARFGQNGGYVVFRDKKLEIAPATFRDFNELQNALYAKAQVA